MKTDTIFTIAVVGAIGVIVYLVAKKAHAATPPPAANAPVTLDTSNLSTQAQSLIPGMPNSILAQQTQDIYGATGDGW